MEIDRINEYDSIKVYTKEDREFIIDKPFYDKAQNNISGLYFREVTKESIGTPFNIRFSIKEIIKIEYLATTKYEV